MNTCIAVRCSPCPGGSAVLPFSPCPLCPHVLAVARYVRGGRYAVLQRLLCAPRRRASAARWRVSRRRPAGTHARHTRADVRDRTCAGTHALAPSLCYVDAGAVVVLCRGIGAVRAVARVANRCSRQPCPTFLTRVFARASISVSFQGTLHVSFVVPSGHTGAGSQATSSSGVTDT